MDARDPAPHHSRTLVQVIRTALSEMPEVYRKPALKHASETIWAELIAQSENAKQAAREAPNELGAKAAAAMDAMRKDAGA